MARRSSRDGEFRPGKASRREMLILRILGGVVRHEWVTLGGRLRLMSADVVRCS